MKKAKMPRHEQRMTKSKDSQVSELNRKKNPFKFLLRSAILNFSSLHNIFKREERS